ncbi:sulfotransferase family 2 domain-containing protein [Isoptericola sp. 178]|uniref:sulfotransferase family 2 domain-containing protein n=1 Tax=Isoptericola sp. 178 TaxID=3064651 RepID=UPI002712981A|nr:sulfotransferase family 2 domain-containing protein [Isoptericola sp. 178]MDO8144148.1 sulfotransferase family 2 domain-containing protein [Isoptericola sp. 178]
MENSLVLTEHRIVFVDVAKNASTSIKWMLADLSGQDPEVFYRGTGMAPTPWQTVHRRSAWRGVRSLSELTASERARISPDGWFVFAVVRDPRVRAWSAWQSKFLVGNPLHTTVKFPDRPWLPRVPTTSDEVKEDFARFVDALGARTDLDLVTDSHFAPQVDLLHEATVPYSRIYDISELEQMLEDLGRHLGTIGVEVRPSLARENGTPLAIAGRVFEPPVRARLEEFYAADLERFGEWWDFDRTVQRRTAWSKDAFRDVAARVAAGRRVADLSLASRELRAERGRAESRARRLEKATATARRQAASHRAEFARLERRLDRATARQHDLRRRVVELEAALERRTVRGFARAVLRRGRRILARASGRARR